MCVCVYGEQERGGGGETKMLLPKPGTADVVSTLRSEQLNVYDHTQGAIGTHKTVYKLYNSLLICMCPTDTWVKG